MINIIINPKETERLDWENNYKDFVDFDGYKAIQSQRDQFELSQKGYERCSPRTSL